MRYCRRVLYNAGDLRLFSFSFRRSFTTRDYYVLVVFNNQWKPERKAVIQ